jgi:hypothetical protein
LTPASLPGVEAVATYKRVALSGMGITDLKPGVAASASPSLGARRRA